MNKSPINILQESSVKEGYFPKYSYALDISKFKCEVTCRNLSATGTGTTKKEAKYNAAVNMLLLLNIPIQSKEHKIVDKIKDLKIYEPTCSNNNQSNDKNISSLLNTQTFPEYNYIGFLQELCVQHHLDLPLYELVQVSGPAHMRTFKVRSNVGSYEMTGIAYCKKTAKQEAAKNVLNLLIASNKLPKDAYKKIENYKKKFYNKPQDTTIEKSNLEIVEPVLSAEVTEITELSENTLSTYIEPISNIAIQKIIDNGSVAFNNNNTIKNTHTSIYQSKSIETANDCKQTLENNCKKLDVSRSIGSAFTKLSESVELNYIESNSTKEQNIITKSSHANLCSSVSIDKDKKHIRTIEDDLREFNIEISDPAKSNETALPLTELSRKVLSAYIASEVFEDSEKYKRVDMCLTDSHNLFKKLYSDKISDDLKERMYIVSKSNKSELSMIQETYQDVQKALGVNLKQINCSNNNRTGVTIICLRMLSKPIITQFGIGDTENAAKGQAMFEIINTILVYLK